MDKSQRRSILVTGANKGIGYAIVEKLLSGPTPYNIILTSRDVTLGEKALSTLREKHSKAPSTLTYHQLDVTDNKSIDNLVSWVQKTYGKLDVLVNNAGIATHELTEEAKRKVINTNYFSVVNVTEKFLPILSDDAKIIPITSTLGLLVLQGETLRKILQKEDLTQDELKNTAERIPELTQDFVSPAPQVPESSYPASKALLNAYMRRVLPKKLKANQQSYAVCPGWVKTDLGGNDAPGTAEDGADTPVYVINLPFERHAELNGRLLDQRKAIDW